MTSRPRIPNPYEVDTDGGLQSSEHQDLHGVTTEPGQRPLTSFASENVSRQRYHPRRSSSVATSNTSSTADGQPDTARQGHGPPMFSDMSNEARRQNIMAMDRKRRLTGSNQEEGRRRHGPSGYVEQDNSSARPFDATSSSTRPTSYPHRRSSNQLPPSSQVVDLAGSSPIRVNNPLPPNPPVQSPPTPSDSVYVIPRWQPDSEASECPICRRPFSFLFRRHHCRKCGRVVCNDCSPHRITIPRQYIVSPPGYEISIESDIGGGAASAGDDTEEEQLRNDDDDSNEDTVYASALARRRRRARAHHLSLGGGEKVRLCNPCVPDPQPEHQQGYASHTLPLPSGFGRRSEPTFPTTSRLGQFAPSRSRELPEPFPRMSFSGHIPSVNHQAGSRSYRNHASTFDSFGHTGALTASHSGPSYHTDHNFGSNATLRDHAHGTHGRYHSFDQSRPGFYPMARPRVRSMLEDRYDIQRSYPTHGPARAIQLKEEDICPVCRRALPPKGIDGDETQREAHIMECITSRDPTSQTLHHGSPGSVSSPPRGPMHMLTFVATEKDCIGEEGGPLECSICMVEYDVGDQLARLECLCKFHRECIVSWFERKQECPVHKVT